jgi:hypothetical protein
MKLIQENPYRVIGILSNATAKEIQSRKSKITAYAKVGKQINSEYDFPFLNSIERDQNSLEKAFSAIQQSKEMLEYSLFWFLNTNSFDEAAITYLKNGDKGKALEIWEKVTINKEVSSKNFSCFNNIGTLKLIETSKAEIKEGIEAKLKLIDSSFFTDFVHSVAGEAIVIDPQKQNEKFVDDLLNQLKDKFSNIETLNLFENCNTSIKKYLANRFTEEPLNQIETAIENTKQKRKQNKSEAYKFGKELYNNTQLNLKHLKSLLDINDLKYKSIADNLAKEIMQCGIDFFNESQENDSNEDYLENAMSLNKLAASIAVSQLTKDKAKDHIATLEKMKDKEISQAIEMLKVVKSLYETNKAKITADVRQMPLGYNQTINWTKVNQMIEKSINWNKVVDLVLEEIPQNNIDKIRQTNDTVRLNEFKSLVDFLMSKLNYSQKNQVKYLCFWKTVNPPPSGCYIATMAYGDYEHPQVLELRKFRDNILNKNLFGRWFIKIYYNYSPLFVEKLQDKPKVNNLIRHILNFLIKSIKK